MRYTTLGASGLRVSRLGFGCMRLPMNADNTAIDRDAAIPLLHRALELGVTYFDTAVGYCKGDSQRVLGEAFAGVPRDRLVLSTKNPAHAATDAEWWGRLEESLRLLRTPYLDVYSLHALTWETFTTQIEKTGKLRLMRQARDQGLIRHIACSFHDTPEALDRLAETGAFEIMTVQYNLLYRELEPAMRRCAERGIGLVVMGPVGGGRLGVESARIRTLLRNAARSTPEAALRFVLANPSVRVALSGMTTLAQVEENCRIVAEEEPFTPVQITSLEEEIARVRAHTAVRCPGCGYCLPCPAGVDIPGHFRVYNDYTLFGLKPTAQRAYRALERNAAACTACGACLSRCPQKLPIPTLLRRIRTELDSPES